MEILSEINEISNWMKDCTGNDSKFFKYGTNDIEISIRKTDGYWTHFSVFAEKMCLDNQTLAKVLPEIRFEEKYWPASLLIEKAVKDEKELNGSTSHVKGELHIMSSISIRISEPSYINLQISSRLFSPTKGKILEFLIGTYLELAKYEPQGNQGKFRQIVNLEKVLNIYLPDEIVLIVGDYLH